MSKKKWIGLIICFSLLTILLLYAAEPTRKLIEGAIIIPVFSVFGWSVEGIRVTIVKSWLWQNYGWFIFGGALFSLGVFTAWLIHGHIYDKAEHWFASRAARHSPTYVTQKQVMAEPRATTPATATTRPSTTTLETPVLEETPQPEPEKKEETKT